MILLRVGGGMSQCLRSPSSTRSGQWWWRAVTLACTDTQTVNQSLVLYLVVRLWYILLSIWLWYISWFVLRHTHTLERNRFLCIKENILFCLPELEERFCDRCWLAGLSQIWWIKKIIRPRNLIKSKVILHIGLAWLNWPISIEIFALIVVA